MKISGATKPDSVKFLNADEENKGVGVIKMKSDPPRKKPLLLNEQAWNGDISRKKLLISNDEHLDGSVRERQNKGY